MRCKWMQTIAWVKDFFHSLEYQHIVNVASALHISTQKRFLKGGHHDVHFWFHIHYQQVFRNKVDDPKFRCYLTLASERGHENWNGKGATKSCARVFLSLGSVSLEWPNGNTWEEKEQLLHPSIWIGLFYCCLRKATISRCWYMYIYNTSFRGKLFVCFCKIFDCLMSLGLIDCLNHSWWVDVRSAHGIDIKNVALAVSSTKGRSNFKNLSFLQPSFFTYSIRKKSECIQLLENGIHFLLPFFWGEDLLHDDEHQWFRGQRWISWCDVWWVTIRSRISGSGKWWEMLAAEFMKVFLKKISGTLVK